MREIALPTYQVHVGRGALGTVADVARAVAPAHRYAIITDETVGRLYGGRIGAALGSADTLVLRLPPGESSKTRETWARLTDELLEAHCGRDTTIIALGGGVVGDIAGFVAATYLRGVPYIQIPTTLLAMIDASIGGKTGVDTVAGKNLVGAFHQPAAVIVDPETLGTLPLAHRRAGFAEAIKHGVIADEAYFEELRGMATSLLSPTSFAGAELESLIARSIEIKAGVVSHDEREGGVRKVLNFGHTVGHAVEAASEYTMLHGEAVAIGMSVESDIAERLGVAEPRTTERLREALQGVGLPARLPARFAIADIVARTRSDKKARAGAVEYALPSRIGAMAGADRGWTLAVPDELIVAALAALA